MTPATIVSRQPPGPMQVNVLPGQPLYRVRMAIIANCLCPILFPMELSEIPATTGQVAASLNGGDWQRLSRLLSGCPDSFLAIDTQGVIRAANETAAETLAYRGETIIGHNVFALLSAPEAARRRAWIKQVLDTGKPFLGVGRLGERRFNIKLNPMVGPGGDVRLITIHAAEIFESNQVQEELRLVRAQLERAQRLESVGQLTGGIAHDFNNLITAMLGFAELAADALPEGSEVREDLAEIVTTGKRAGELVRQLLAFVRQNERGATDVDVREQLTLMEPLLRTLLGSERTLETRYSSTFAFVSFDPSRLEQVMVNLIVNCRDAMPRGGKVTIETSVSKGASRELTISVSDSGKGIPQEVRDSVFEPFFSTKSPDQGSGLGLATCARILLEAGGRISIKDSSSTGTTFEAVLPVSGPEA